jgi:hypothetical protein
MHPRMHNHDDDRAEEKTTLDIVKTFCVDMMDKQLRHCEKQVSVVETIQILTSNNMQSVIDSDFVEVRNIPNYISIYIYLSIYACSY